MEVGIIVFSSKKRTVIVVVRYHGSFQCYISPSLLMRDKHVMGLRVILVLDSTERYVIDYRSV